MKTKMKTRIAAVIAAAAIATGTVTMPSFAAQTKYNDSSVTLYDVLNKSYQTNWITDEQRKFPTDTYWNAGEYGNGGDADKYTDQQCSCNTDHMKRDNKFRLYNIYSKGYTDKWEYDQGTQCYGFAMKLATDFYGGYYGKSANAWIRFSNNALRDDITGMQIRVGDQLQIELKGKMNPKPHAVFITKVDGDKLTFADCNWGDTCRIRWDGSAEIVGNDIRFSEQLYKITQIYRPIMAGDVNGDSEFNAADIQLILQIAKRNVPVYDSKLKKMVTRGDSVFEGRQKDIMMQAADLNDDGKVTLDDWDMAWDEWNRDLSKPKTGKKCKIHFLTNVGEVK